MEAAVVNTLSPGEKVVCASIGSFGDRFGKIAENFGAEVKMVKFPQGTAVEVDELRRVLDADPEISAVLVTHNETNTGVTNDIERVASVVKNEFDKLLLVDGYQQRVLPAVGDRRLGPRRGGNGLAEGLDAPARALPSSA